MSSGSRQLGSIPWTRVIQQPFPGNRLILLVPMTRRARGAIMPIVWEPPDSGNILLIKMEIIMGGLGVTNALQVLPFSVIADMIRL